VEDGKHGRPERSGVGDPGPDAQARVTPRCTVNATQGHRLTVGRSPASRCKRSEQHESAATPSSARALFSAK
jgi:hypothetical protein